ncbi:MAG TPA: MerR family transcriptional regulator [Rhizomicrobium sp.]|nr:MerR family transcriptional regulator [Rhizomicrobium sp.]
MSSAAFAFSHKSAGAFRTISEVAIELNVPQHVLRFWESRFAQIRPVKRAGGRRYYRPEDIDLLKGIRSLLYSDGFTIKGVQKVLKDRGLRHVADVGRGCVPEPAPQVIEKIVYVEKPAAAPVKKPRPGHLRAVPGMSLPFFNDMPPVREFPVLDSAPAPQPAGTIASLVEAVEAFAAEDTSEPAQNHERLEEILDELTGLKARLRAARER